MPEPLIVLRDWHTGEFIQMVQGQYGSSTRPLERSWLSFTLPGLSLDRVRLSLSQTGRIPISTDPLLANSLDLKFVP
jgi:hypothetical protein